jgi:hypothetical protein
MLKAISDSSPKYALSRKTSQIQTSVTLTVP